MSNMDSKPTMSKRDTHVGKLAMGMVTELEKKNEKREKEVLAELQKISGVFKGFEIEATSSAHVISDNIRSRHESHGRQQEYTKMLLDLLMNAVSFKRLFESNVHVESSDVRTVMDDIIMQFCIGWKYTYVPLMIVFNSDDRFILDRVSAVNDGIMGLVHKHFKGTMTYSVIGAISFVEYCASQMLYGTREEKDPMEGTFEWDMFAGKGIPDWWTKSGVSDEVHELLQRAAEYLMQRHPVLDIKLGWKDKKSVGGKCGLDVIIAYHVKTKDARVPSVHGDSARSRSSHEEDSRSSYDPEEHERSIHSYAKKHGGVSDVSYYPDELSFHKDSEIAASMYKDATSKFIPGGDLVEERVMQVLHQQMDKFLGEYAAERMETIIAKKADAAIKLQSMKNDTQIQVIFAGLKASMEKKHTDMKQMCKSYDVKINQFESSAGEYLEYIKAYLGEKEKNLDKSIQKIQDQSRKNDAKIQKGIVDMQESISSQTETIEASLKAIEETSKANDEKIGNGIVDMQKTIDVSLKVLDNKSKEIDKKIDASLKVLDEQSSNLNTRFEDRIARMRNNNEAQFQKIKQDIEAEYGTASFRKTTDIKIEGLKKYVNQLLGTKPDGADTSQQSTPAPPPAPPQAVTTPQQAATNQPKGKKKK